MTTAFTLFLLVSLVAGLVIVARQWGKSVAMEGEAKDAVDALHKSIDEAEDVQNIRRDAVANPSSVSKKHYID